jgi:hypothetical protein
MPGHGTGQGHGRVDMGTGDMANRIDGGHHCQAKAQANPQRGRVATRDRIDNHGTRSCKDQQEGAKEFSSIET